MPVKKLTIAACVFFSFQFSYAQENWIGASISYTSDLYDISDQHDNILPVPLVSPEISLYWRHIYANNIFTQVGASTKEYWEGFEVKGAPVYMTSDAFRVVKLNADIDYRLMLTRKLAFVPGAGASIAMNTMTYLATAVGSQSTRGSGYDMQYIYQESPNAHRFFGLAHVAVAFEHNLWRRFTLNVHAGYHKGFMTANQLNVQYRINQQPVYDATVRSVGDYWDVGIGVSYLFTRL